MPNSLWFVPLLALAALPLQAESVAELQAQVKQAEMGFAKTMDDRDHAGMARFVAEDAVFVGSKSTQHGRAEVMAAWKPLYEGAKAPFSWAPESIEVLESKTLALSSGTVRDPEGKILATFNSIWRREKDGRWRVVFDKGCPACNCGPIVSSGPSGR
jgi:ketosteroid isomerase-like protein